MSALQDAIRQRRSIRRFRDKPIPESLLVQVLDAGRWAPSAGNTQPWRIILVSDAEIRSELIEMMAGHLKEHILSEGATEEARTIEENLEMLSSAPILIVACMTKEVFGERLDRWLSEHTMGVQSVAAAIQNMLLVAHDEGLGACWFCAPLFCQNVVRTVLKIPQHVDPQALITLGYLTANLDPPQRKSLEEIVDQDCWMCTP